MPTFRKPPKQATVAFVALANAARVTVTLPAAAAALELDWTSVPVVAAPASSNTWMAHPV